MSPQKPNRRPQTGGKVLRPVRTNAGIEAAYRKRLERIVENLHRSTLWWIRAEYRKRPPAIAQDATPFEWMRRVVGKLRDRWVRSIEEAAPKLADYFAQATQNRVDADLKKILRDGGFSIKWQETAGMRDVRAALIAENVALIKSIPSQFFDRVEGIISRGYASGFDLKTVTDELQHAFGLSRKRAAFIASDQASKLSSQLSARRSIDAGLFTAIWKHSHAGKKPRPSHLNIMDGQEFDLREGLFDPDPKVRKKVLPGFLPRCRCTHRVVVPFGNARKAQAERPAYKR